MDWTAFTVIGRFLMLLNPESEASMDEFAHCIRSRPMTSTPRPKGMTRMKRMNHERR